MRRQTNTKSSLSRKHYLDQPNLKGFAEVKSQDGHTDAAIRFKEFWAKISIGLNFAGLMDIAAFGI